MEKKLDQDIKKYIHEEDYLYISKYIYQLNEEKDKLEEKYQELKKEYINLEKKYNSLSKSKLVKIAYKVTKLKRKIL